MDSRYEAAWVPDDDPTRSWEVGVAAAVDWVQSRSGDRGRPLLVTATLDVGDGEDALRGMERATSRSRATVTGPTGRPILTFVPYARELELAAGYARRAALCVVETSSFPVRGWARTTRARNLLTGEVLPPLQPETAELLERLRFSGNNAWSDSYGKDRAADLLDRLRAFVDRAEILGYVLATGGRSGGAERLAKIMDKAGWPSETGS